MTENTQSDLPHTHSHTHTHTHRSWVCVCVCVCVCVRILVSILYSANKLKRSKQPLNVVMRLF